MKWEKLMYAIISGILTGVGLIFVVLGVGSIVAGPSTLVMGFRKRSPLDLELS